MLPWPTLFMVHQFGSIGVYGIFFLTLPSSRVGQNLHIHRE